MKRVEEIVLAHKVIRLFGLDRDTYNLAFTDALVDYIWAQGDAEGTAWIVKDRDVWTWFRAWWAELDEAVLRLADEIPPSMRRRIWLRLRADPDLYCSPLKAQEYRKLISIYA